MLTKCKQCGLEFNTKPSQIKKGKGLFCSRRCYGDWQRINKPSHWGVNSPNFDKDELLKIRKNHSNKLKGKPSWNKGKKLNYMPANAFKKGEHVGEKHPNWKGGKTLYWKKKALERDNYTCQVCKLEDKDIMDVHHIKELKSEHKRRYGVDDLNNMITLCPNCHRKVHKNIVKPPLLLM